MESSAGPKIHMIKQNAIHPLFLIHAHSGLTRCAKINQSNPSSTNELVEMFVSRSALGLDVTAPDGEMRLQLPDTELQQRPALPFESSRELIRWLFASPAPNMHAHCPIIGNLSSRRMQHRPDRSYHEPIPTGGPRRSAGGLSCRPHRANAATATAWSRLIEGHII